MDEMMKRLEKTAGVGGALRGVGNYLKNVSGHNVKKTQKRIDNVKAMDREPSDLLMKDLHNKKVDRNIARAGTGGAAVLGGGLYGGVKNVQKQNNEVTDEMENNKVASTEELMARLEKTANENMRQDRKLLTESMLGAGTLGHYAKQNNKMGVRPEDSHAMANAKLGAGANAIGGGLSGATMGAVLNQATGKSPLLGGLIGAGAGAGIGAAAGGINGAINGYFHDRWDQTHPQQQEGGEEGIPVEQAQAEEGAPPLEEAAAQNSVEDPRQGAGSVSSAPAGVDKSASELMERLEKTASGESQNNNPADAMMKRLEKTAGIGGVAKSVGTKAKDFANKVSGKEYRDSKKALDSLNSPEALKAHAPMTGVSNYRNKLESLDSAANKAQADMKKAQKQTAIVGGGGAAGLAAGGALSKKDDEDRQKTASESNDDEEKKGKQGQSKDKETARQEGKEGKSAEEGKKGRSVFEGLIGKSKQEGEEKKASEKSEEDEEKKGKQGQSKDKETARQQGKEGKSAEEGKKGRSVFEGLIGKSKQEGEEGAEKKANEDDDILDGLFKEAAAAIIDDTFPEVKQHVDPMSRITF